MEKTPILKPLSQYPQPSQPQHPEALSKLTLIRQLLADPLTQFQPRATDTNWFYEKLVPYQLFGFNPLQGKIYYSAHSQLAQWLKNPHQQARLVNYRDQLIPEVFAMVHEYLHIWALGAIMEVLPTCEYGQAPITEKNFEDFVFCHLLTEVVASVGTDYWFLCTLDLNKECNLGSRHRGGLQTSYHENDIAEFQKFSPELVVQDKKFFHQLVDVYLGGFIGGFEEEALKESPKLYTWLTHELTYGETGRKGTRTWLMNYSEGRVKVPTDVLEDPCLTDKPWKRDLIDSLSELLWEKVKKDRLHNFKRNFDFAGSWRSHPKALPDFRFANVNKMKDLTSSALVFPKADPFEFQILFYQLVIQCRYDKFDMEIQKLFSHALERQDVNLALSLFRNQEKVETLSGEPYDLFLMP